MKDINDVSTEWLGNVLAGNIRPDGDQMMQLARIVMEMKYAQPDFYAYYNGAKYGLTKHRDVAERAIADKQGASITPLYGIAV